MQSLGNTCLFLFCLLIGEVNAQNFNANSYKVGTQSIATEEYRPSANYDRIFVCFDSEAPMDGALQQQLIAFGNHFKARIIHCAQPLDVETWRDFTKQLQLDSHHHVFVFASGRAANNAVGAFMSDEFGFLHTPEFDTSTLNMMKTLGGVSISNQELDSVIDMLSSLGFWVNQTAFADDSKIFEKENYPSIQRALDWSDSLSLIVRDSLKRTELYSMAGLQNTIPEVLRQGKGIDLEILVTTPAEFRIEMVNLSSEAIWSERAFFGRGIHKIRVPTDALDWGVYHLEIQGAQVDSRYKIIIRG